jgi:hypothetical protein
MCEEKVRLKTILAKMNEELFNHILYQDLKLAGINKMLILRNGSVHKLNTDFCFVDFFEQYISNSTFNQESTPFLISTGCGRLPQIEKIRYSDSIIKYLNKQGLSIFLFEDLYIGTGNKVRNLLKGPTPNNSEYYQTYQYYVRGFESTVDSLQLIYSDELESIAEFVKNNALTNVTVYTCDYNSEKYFQDKYPSFKIKTRNLFLISSAARLTNIKPTAVDIGYKFWCGNSRYRAVRHIIAAYLYGKNSLISLNQTRSIYGTLQNQLWFELKNWDDTNKEIYSYLKTELKKLVKIPVLEISKEQPLSNYGSYEFLNYSKHEEAFCSVITETRFSQPTTTFSEKTLSAIAKLRPFILVAPPYALEYLKSYGFKTFSDYWDESYDQETNHEQRLLKIFKVIDYIDTLSINDLKMMLTDMEKILNHNYQTLTTIGTHKYA